MDRYQPQDLHEIAGAALRAHAVPDHVAVLVVDVLLEADRRGIASHGLFRLPSYLQRVAAGLIDPAAEPSVLVDHSALVVLDGQNGFGAVAGMRAVELAAQRAKEFGVAWITVRNTNHFGIAAAYTKKLARSGCAAIVFGNTAPAMAAFGGHRPVLGTNPLSMAVPAGGKPLVLDMATSVVARGALRQAADYGKPLPAGWALDAAGQPTTDAAAGLAGTLLAAAGPKGYGLAVLIDAMSGLISGGRVLTEVGETSDFTQTSGVSFTLIAADTNYFPDDTDSGRGEQFRRMVREFGR